MHWEWLGMSKTERASGRFSLGNADLFGFSLVDQK